MNQPERRLQGKTTVRAFLRSKYSWEDSIGGVFSLRATDRFTLEGEFGPDGKLIEFSASERHPTLERRDGQWKYRKAGKRKQKEAYCVPDSG